MCSFFFFFNDTATTEIYPLSLHDALPICPKGVAAATCSPPSSACPPRWPPAAQRARPPCPTARDRKSTRLNSSHQIISYAVFCLKKKKQIINQSTQPDDSAEQHVLRQLLA